VADVKKAVAQALAMLTEIRRRATPTAMAL